MFLMEIIYAGLVEIMSADQYIIHVASYGKSLCRCCLHTPLSCPETISVHFAIPNDVARNISWWRNSEAGGQQMIPFQCVCWLNIIAAGSCKGQWNYLLNQQISVVVWHIMTLLTFIMEGGIWRRPSSTMRPRPWQDTKRARYNLGCMEVENMTVENFDAVGMRAMKHFKIAACAGP